MTRGLGESLTVIGKLLGHTRIQNAASRITRGIGGNLAGIDEASSSSNEE